MSASRVPRMRKVNEMLREVIADEVHQLKDPRIGFVTVTGVDCAPDLRAAKVYYSVLGDADEQEATQEALQHSAPHIQAAVGSQVRIKYLPKLRFLVDESVERGLRVEQLLRGVDTEEDDSDA